MPLSLGHTAPEGLILVSVRCAAFLGKPEMPEISKHAAMRYLNRIDSSEPYPRERLREIVDENQTTHRQDIEGAVVEARDALVVLKENCVTTVLRECETA